MEWLKRQEKQIEHALEHETMTKEQRKRLSAILEAVVRDICRGNSRKPLLLEKKTRVEI